MVLADFDEARHPPQLRPYLSALDDGLLILAAPSTRAEMRALTPLHYGRALGLLRGGHRADGCAGGIGDLQEWALRQADQAVVFATPDFVAANNVAKVLIDDDVRLPRRSTLVLNNPRPEGDGDMSAIEQHFARHQHDAVMPQNAGPPFGHLAPENAARLEAILNVQIPDTIRLTRLIESETGYVSPRGRDELNRVLAGLSALNDPGLSREAQAARLSKIDEQLRRVLIEHHAEVAQNRLGELLELWEAYEGSCYPYRETGELRGAPRHEELEELRSRISRHLERVRDSDARECCWEEAIDAAAAATQAARLAGELAKKLDQCIGTATKLDRDTHRFRITIAVGIVAIVVSAVLACAGTLTSAETRPTPAVRTIIRPTPKSSKRLTDPHQGTQGRPARGRNLTERRTGAGTARPAS